MLYRYIWKSNFEVAYCKIIFWPHDLHMQPIKTVWTILVWNHSGIIPVKFGKKPKSGFKQDV